MTRTAMQLHASILLTTTVLAGQFKFSYTQTGNICTLCRDGSAPKVNAAISLYGEEWQCSQVSAFIETLAISLGEECTAIQATAYKHCGCQAFPQLEYCPLCPGGAVDIPYPTIRIPGVQGLTCDDVLLTRRDDSTGVSCNDIPRFEQLCRCPERCSFCRYDDTPSFPDRIIPYLTENDQTVTCASHAAAAALVPIEQCSDYRQAPVALDVQAFCGCPYATPSELCPLCAGGRIALQNEDLTIAEAGGLSCSEIAEYLRFVTDLDSCLAISELAQACCEESQPCPVCSDESVGYDRSKTYEPYSLTCEDIGFAQMYGYPMTCQDVQQRFPYFCGCPNAVRDCTVCLTGESPPVPARLIPLLGITCLEVDDSFSLRTSEECSREVNNLPIDVAAFCGCEGSSPPRLCAICPFGENLSGGRLKGNKGFEATCDELAQFAQYVVNADFCQAIKNASRGCCESPSAPFTLVPIIPPIAPIVARQPTTALQPTSIPYTIAPIIPPINAITSPPPTPYNGLSSPVSPESIQSPSILDRPGPPNAPSDSGTADSPVTLTNSSAVETSLTAENSPTGETKPSSIPAVGNEYSESRPTALTKLPSTPTIGNQNGNLSAGGITHGGYVVGVLFSVLFSIIYMMT